MQLFPFLAVIPASFVLLENRETRYEIYICSRIGKQRYHFSATISAALTTFVVFFLPFLLEIALNVLAFPLQAFGDPSNLSCYDPLYLKIVSRYFWPSLYVKMPYLYAVLNVVVVSLTSAVIGLLPFAIGGFLKGKYKLVLFLPTYLLFYVLQIWGGSVPGEFSTSYFDYLSFCLLLYYIPPSLIDETIGEQIYITRASWCLFFDDMTANLGFVNTMRHGQYYLIFLEGKVELPEAQKSPTNIYYDAYLNYCVKNRIVSSDEYSSLDAYATRAQIAHIFAKATSDFAVVNDIDYDYIPDVSERSEYADEILALYRAGILTGDERTRAFRPSDTITRAEAAAIISRVALPTTRIKIV